MSLVNYETGEVIEYDRAAAERRAERIRLRLDSIADSYTAVMPMIREAIEKRDDLALGYRSVSEYVSDRFGGALTRLGVEVRREVVRELTEAGMSSRAIAPIVGTSHATVQSDVRSGGKSFPPAPAPAPAPEGEAEVGAGSTPQGEAPPAEPVEEVQPEPAKPRPAVTGIDGKTYKRPEPKPESKPRATPRRALPDQFFDAAYDTAKKVESLHRLIGDDRFPQNAEKVAAKHRNDLLRTRDLLEQVINALPTEESTRD